MIAIISDVHGNYPALKAVMEEIDKLGCSKIISLGDVVGYYCMINECIDEFRRRKVINIMGNHDAYLLGLCSCRRSSTVNEIIKKQKRIITRENFEYLKESKTKIDDGVLSARHGGWNDPIDEYVQAFDFNTHDKDARIFCSGHTHIQKIQKTTNAIYFNPGSVGQPRDNNPSAAYAIINNDDVLLKRTKYNINEIIDEMKKNNYDDRITSCLQYGRKIG